METARIERVSGRGRLGVSFEGNSPQEFPAGEGEGAYVGQQPHSQSVIGWVFSLLQNWYVEKPPVSL